MKHLRLYNEAINTGAPFNFRAAVQLVEWLDSNYPELDKYRNHEAQYDDVWYSIPFDIWESVTGLSMGDINRIAQSFDDYEGSVMYYGDTVSILCGA